MMPQPPQGGGGMPPDFLQALLSMGQGGPQGPQGQGGPQAGTIQCPACQTPLKLSPAMPQGPGPQGAPQGPQPGGGRPF